MTTDAQPATAETDGGLPRIDRRLLAGFAKYTGWTLRRQFHAIHVAGTQHLDSLRDTPVIVYLNHPSWWDPLTCLFLARHFLWQRPHYAVIDAAALQRYGFFRRLGFFGVEPGTTAGARTFLRQSLRALNANAGTLWLTPQGHFADCRARPVALQPGLSHLVRRAPAQTHLLPLALEYPFGLERQPEIAARFGEVVPVDDLRTASTDTIDRHLSDTLAATMEALARAVITRDTDAFDRSWSGAAGTDFCYDLWQRLKAWATGRRFERKHASVVRT